MVLFDLNCFSIFFEYFEDAIPARLPKTSISAKKFPPKRLAP